MPLLTYVLECYMKICNKEGVVRKKKSKMYIWNVYMEVARGKYEK